MLSTRANLIRRHPVSGLHWRSSGVLIIRRQQLTQKLTKSNQFELGRPPKMLNKLPILVLDWDETITTKDTTSLIASIAEINSPKELSFSYFTKKYMESYLYFENLFRGEYGEIDSMEKEIHFQKGLKTIELVSINRLEQHHFFKGVHISKFRDAAKQIDFKPNCSEMLRNWNLPIYILSINWSRTMIEERLKLEGVNNVKVMANDLSNIDNIATGKFEARYNIRTGYDKLKVLRQLKIDYPNEKLLYVGDSHGDVLPIADADIGILIQNGKGISQLKKIFGDVRQLSDCKSEFSFELSGIYTGSWLQLASLFKCSLRDDIFLHE